MIRSFTVAVTVFLGVFSITALAQSNEQAVALAMDHFRVNARSYGLNSPDRELVVRKMRLQGDRVVIRLDQLYRGLKVFEGEAIVRVALSTRSVEVTNALRGNLSIDTQPGIFASQAVATALRSIGARGRANTSSSLEILPQGQRSGRDVLVWHVRANLRNELDDIASWDYFIDAKTGAIVWYFNSLHTQAATAVATGKTMYSGDVTLNVTLNGATYSLINPLQGTPSGNSTNNHRNRYDVVSMPFTSPIPIFGDNNLNNTDPNTAGADAHYALDTTWSYYAASFGRDGIDDEGRRTFQKIHFGQNFQNAFWDDECFCMTYGDGGSTYYAFVSLDIAGHEMSHGVTASEANLTYVGESGGLNEATSDIFGTMVEFSANNLRDTPEYWIGERAKRSNYVGGNYTQTSALRYMDHPSNDGQSPNCWSAGIGGLNVHYSSGPANHMFYLLAHGGTSECNGNVVAGIGNGKAAAIWYNALITYMTSSTNYHGARTAALNSANGLFGAGSPEYNATAAAFAAINVN